MSTVLVVHAGELGELIATQFEQYGVRAAHCTTGEAALERALLDPPVAIVVDTELPDASGLDLADLLASELSIPVVATYDAALLHDDAGLVQKMRLSKLDAAFAKPFRSLALITRVAELAGLTLRAESMAPAQTTSATLEAIDGFTDLLLAVSQEGAAVTDAPAMATPLPDAPVPIDGADIGDDDLVAILDTDVVTALEAIDKLAPNEVELDIDVDVDEPTFDDTPEAIVVGQEVRTATRTLTSFVAEKEHGDPSSLALLWRRMREANDSRPPDARAAVPPISHSPSGPHSPARLAELLDAFHQSQSSGEILVENGPERRLLLVARGAVTGVRSNMPTDALLGIAERRGVLTIEAAKRARAAIRDRRVPSELHALTALRVPPRVIGALLVERARRTVAGAFLQKTGTIRVTTDGTGERERTPVRIPLGDAIVRSIILTEPIESLRMAAPDDARFAPNPDATYTLADLSLSADEVRLVIAMDGTKTVADLAALFERVPERTRRGLAAALHRIGIVRSAGRGPASARKISFF
jgi:CheY-like chemotaxis protein